jgi:antitoxin PrlF
MPMSKATVTYKGQITLPKAVREQLGVRAGDRVSFREIEGGVIVVEADTVDLMELRGSIKARRRGISVDDMDRTILAAVARKK